MLEMSSDNSYHFRPHCTRRTASAMTCSSMASEERGTRPAVDERSVPDGRAVGSRPAASARPAVLSSLAAAGFAGADLPSGAGFSGGVAAGFATVLASALASAVLRSVRATCCVLTGAGARGLLAMNLGHLPGPGGRIRRRPLCLALGESGLHWRAFALGIGQGNEAFDVFGTHQVRQENHQFQGIGKLGIARFDALFDLIAQGQRFLLGQVDDPAAGSLVLRPWLDLRIAVVVEREYFRCRSRLVSHLSRSSSRR